MRACYGSFIGFLVPHRRRTSNICNGESFRADDISPIHHSPTLHAIIQFVQCCILTTPYKFLRQKISYNVGNNINDALYGCRRANEFIMLVVVGS